MTKKKEKVDSNIIITAIIAVTVIEIVALCLGYNGTLQKICFALIAGLAGIVIPTPKILKK